MMTNAEAEELGFSFNYTAAEWAKIAHEIGGMLRPLPLEYCRARLCDADKYRLDMRHQNKPGYIPPPERAPDFEKVADLARQLAEAIKQANNPEKPLFITGDFYKVDDIPKLTDIERRVDAHWTALVLHKWAERADDLVDTCRGKYRVEGEPYGPRERDRTRRIFRRAIFQSWTSAGGELRTANNPQVAGPLIRYFLALARPVMGDDTPTLATIAGYIREERKRPTDGEPHSDISPNDLEILRPAIERGGTKLNRGGGSAQK